MPTLTGRVSMTLPKGASSGQVLRLKGKGVQAAGRPAGDQRVALSVRLPKEIDPELERFIADWRAKHRYDPRAGMGSGR